MPIGPRGLALNPCPSLPEGFVIADELLLSGNRFHLRVLPVFAGAAESHVVVEVGVVGVARGAAWAGHVVHPHGT